MSPSGLKTALRLRDGMLRRLRRFFQERGFTEVDTPVRVFSPGIDPYIDALPAGEGLFLATSPELEMKKLLALGMERIYQLARAFRGGESGDIHHPEFTLLEWYAAGEDYGDCMDFTEGLVRDAASALAEEGWPAPAVRLPRPFSRVSVDEAFERHAGWVPSRRFEADRFFRDLIEKVEPALERLGAVFLFDFPERVGALARPKPGDPSVCERFELYLAGVEICNGFTELTDADEQGRRFERDNAERRRLGKEAYPVDRVFLDALRAGVPPCAGNALGVDRLLMVLTGRRHLADVTLLAGRGTVRPVGSGAG